MTSFTRFFHVVQILLIFISNYIWIRASKYQYPVLVLTTNSRDTYPDISDAAAAEDSLRILQTVPPGSDKPWITVKASSNCWSWYFASIARPYKETRRTHTIVKYPWENTLESSGGYMDSKGRNKCFLFGHSNADHNGQEGIAVVSSLSPTLPIIHSFGHLMLNRYTATLLTAG